ncbi:MAG: replicative helicase [Epulopiscium sp.]|jgi:replicative DNA helicase|uniref:Replicative DNA helicase n=1 Tax=Defluviitalea raffinosedens TaxID=1450156 RepID=A0A7C8LDT9_9FIRM|nr:replicative DNA helicase [Defluviitalea raffinosedens]MBZ4669014.1 dnaB [Defluviitaleaceae bacterium]MDK2787827.1 replicative helicase [Candidatus Epulonipiscium sp.]KAE9632970.1 replicative DNA helicase [Defluviitalea raffinosedens]MBM7684643.1 replicative DNA helicase [Defluviitalea raffinosedens]HHW68256.1 replicative DNA helicase [Candidatus Epulonipiscium sp.]
MEESRLQRIPPHNIEAEQSVLGSMILDREAIASAAEILRGDDFYRPDHKMIFETCIELFNQGAPVDLVTLKSRLEEKGLLEQIGGIAYLSELASSVPTSAHIKQYAKIVESKSILRRLIKASQDIMGLSYEAKEDVNTILNQAEQSIFHILQNKHTEDFSPMREVLLSAFEKIEEIYKNQGKVTGLSTGFIDLDYKTAGLQPSDLILVAARPSMGKTAFALNIAQYAAVREKVPIAIFSLEMSKEQLVNRMLCAEAMIDAQKLRTGAMNQEDWVKIARAMGTLAEAPIYIDDTPGISVMEMRAKCRRLKLEKGLGLILIDYLQLMSGSGKSDSRQQEISEISRSLKALAREMEAPVIALSQLSRACETRADHRPMLSDLRESGAIEQDADVVMFLYRDEYYHPDTEKKNQAEVIIAKQRNGPTGTVDLVWLGQYTKFANMQKAN